MTLRLHVILAARILWMPNSISRVHDWVPIMPYCPDGVYRLDRFLDAKRKVSKLLNYDIVADCGPGVDYHSYNMDGSHPWLEDGHEFGPTQEGRPFLEPEPDRERSSRDNKLGKKSRRDTGEQHVDNETAILCYVREKLVVTTKQVANHFGVSKKVVSRILYEMRDFGVVHKIIEMPPTWASTDESGWGKVLRTECSNTDSSEARL